MPALLDACLVSTGGEGWGGYSTRHPGAGTAGIPVPHYLHPSLPIYSSHLCPGVFRHTGSVPRYKEHKSTVVLLVSLVHSGIKNSKWQCKTSLQSTYIGRFGLSIPAVARIMGHLILHVLSEAEFLRRYSNLHEVEVDAANEIA